MASTTSRSGLRALVSLALLMCGVVLTAQTRVTPPKNSYSPAQDVKLGLQAASQVEQQMPIMKDDSVESYVERLGRRLVTAIPPDLQQSEFQYTFKVVNVREINAFALPGGPMFVNRGMIEQAHTEGEVAGVMAHELSHVVLRHGTAQASKAQKYEAGQVAGALLGAIIGGRVGSVVSQGTQFGLGAAFLRFSREYEQQADIEGSHIMAAAGYDPRDMANVFKTIEQQGGPGGPQWLSDHPNPGNRYEYINREAELLRVTNPVRDTQTFDQVQAHLKEMPRAPTTEEATKATRNESGGESTRSDAPPPTGRVAPPSTRYSSYSVGNLFSVSVPSNWKQAQSANSVTFAPDGATGAVNGQSVFTHGVEIGIARNETHDLQTSTDELVQSLARTNARLGRPAPYRSVTVGNRPGLETIMSNVSDATRGEETIDLFTTLLRDGTLLYIIGVAPQEEFDAHQAIFERVAASIKLNNPS
jgi:beta-barrel assembly-enhancing protease